MKIAIDGMGGDGGPRIIVKGVVDGVNEFGHNVVIVGDKPSIERELSGLKFPAQKIEVCHSSQVVEMGESPAVTIRKKKDSSISVGVRLVKEGKADAFISAGNTGAVVCAATLYLGLLPGIERPGIAIIYPTPAGISMLIDVGANITPKPIHLLQYGFMGDAYSKHILGKKNPTVGLLNVGEEETKGTGFVKDTHKLLIDSMLNFVGNIEGRDIFSGKTDVIVCDGFAGNVVLKVAESLTLTISKFLRRELKKNLLTRIGALLSRPAFKGLKKDLDYTEYGGAPLLGVAGAVTICHGSSNVKAIKNAVRVTGEYVTHRVNEHIAEEIASDIS